MKTTKSKRQGAARKGQTLSTTANGGMGPQTTAPAATARATVTGIPSIRNVKGGILITHSEAVDVISGTSNYFLRTYNINPGNADVFPWLAGKATSYEQYKFQALSFSYQTRTSTDRAGSICGCMDYDAYDTAPSSSAQMLTYRGAREGVAWTPALTWVADAKRIRLKARYVRSLATTNGDLRNYDLSKFYVSTENFATTEISGRLMVSYSVMLLYEQTQLQEPTSLGTFGLATTVVETGGIDFTAFTTHTLQWEIGDNQDDSTGDGVNHSEWNGLDVVLSSQAPLYASEDNGFADRDTLMDRRLKDCKSIAEQKKLWMAYSKQRAADYDFSTNPLRTMKNYSIPKDKRGVGALQGTYFTMPPGKYQFSILFDSANFDLNVTNSQSYLSVYLQYQDLDGTSGTLGYATIEKALFEPPDTTLTYFQLNMACAFRVLEGRVMWFEIYANDSGNISESPSRLHKPCVAIRKA